MSVTLNDAQTLAVETEEAALCCACPGSGKTRVLVAKVCHIFRTHADPWILMTTFSRDAAEEMLERVQKEPGIPKSNLRRLTIGTFHALAMRQLKGQAEVGKILSEIETRHLIERALHDTGLNMSIEEADMLIANYKADPARDKASANYRSLVKRYQELLKQAGGGDFTDLLLQANLQMESGQIKPIRATHLLADEIQDIDQLQYNWLMHHVRQNPVLCCSGDDDQSIYGFRRSLGYRGMMNIVADTGAQIITLDTNYRSTSGIINAASRLISYNVDRIPKQIKAARGAGPEPRVISLNREDSTAEHIISILDILCSPNQVPQPLPGRDPFRFGVAPGQAAVLSRMNSQLNAIEEAFIKKKVPYLRSGRSLWDARTLQVYMAILESLAQKNSIGLEIALRWMKISETDIKQLRELAQGDIWNFLDPGQNLPLPATTRGELASLFQLGRGWAEKLTNANAEEAAIGPIHGVHLWMEAVMKRTCDVDEDGNVIRDQRKSREIRDMDRLNVASNLLQNTRGDLMTRIRRQREKEASTTPRIILTTFHASKGLEWDHVFLTDVHDGSVPKLSPDYGEDELSEERRVFYVAMTRARDSLTIYSRCDIKPSEFLIEAELYPAGR